MNYFSKTVSTARLLAPSQFSLPLNAHKLQFSQQTTNYNDEHYVGSLFIGALSADIKVIFDTQATLSYVESYLCSSCTNSYTYDYSVTSTLGYSFTAVPDSNVTFTGLYEGSGFYAYDYWCLVDNSD
jgi:hypothetical protein